MPCVNPKYECEPCKRGNHAWCTMENECMCPNTWDGEGWRENIRREASKMQVRALTTHPDEGRPHSGVRPLVGAGRASWFCTDCGFQSRWWKGCERFKYCTDCERRHREIARRRLAIEGKITRGRDDGMIDGGKEGAGQGVQPPLPLPVHTDGRRTDSPCDKKEPFSA